MSHRVTGPALIALGASAALAQQYPSKPITIVVPAAAGGPSDTVARVVAPALAKELKGTVIIENQGGAGGTIGAGRVARAPGDGYTLYLYHIAHSTWPALYRKLAFDVVKDFEPIGLINEVPMTLVGKKDLAAKDFKELVAWIKANGKKVTIGNAGVGSASHLCGLLFMQAIQTELTPVPYKGTGPAMNDLLGGQIDLMCDQTTNTTSQIKSGKIKVYAVTTLTRLPTMTDVADARRARTQEFRAVGVAWTVGAQGHAEADHRSAFQGVAGRGQGSRRHAALRRSRCGAGRGRRVQPRPRFRRE